MRAQAAEPSGGRGCNLLSAQARTAWSLYNAFTELAKSTSPRAQVEDTLRLTQVFRQELKLRG